MDVFGLVDGTVGETTWSEGTATWNNVVANVTTSDTDFTDATPLGSFDVTSALGLYTFSSAALTSFLNADTNGEVTLMFSTADQGAFASFDSKEDLIPSAWPFLEITSVPEPSAFVLAAIGLAGMAFRRKK